MVNHIYLKLLDQNTCVNYDLFLASIRTEIESGVIKLAKNYRVYTPKKVVVSPQDGVLYFKGFDLEKAYSFIPEIFDILVGTMFYYDIPNNRIYWLAYWKAEESIVNSLRLIAVRLAKTKPEYKYVNDDPEDLQKQFIENSFKNRTFPAEMLCGQAGMGKSHTIKKYVECLLTKPTKTKKRAEPIHIHLSAFM